jgi:hypothetical protein
VYRVNWPCSVARFAASSVAVLFPISWLVVNVSRTLTKWSLRLYCEVIFVISISLAFGSTQMFFIFGMRKTKMELDADALRRLDNIRCAFR